MSELPGLIHDLAFILVTAGIVALIMRRLKWPIVVGYILAGLLVGPKLNLFPRQLEPENLRTWAELGVIFLMFHMGLEFSFRKLFELGGGLFIITIIEVGGMFSLGFGIGSTLGWTWIPCLFLGGIVSISSTSVILKTFEELNLRSQKFAQNCLGVLVIEDLLALVMMVVLTTVGLTQQFKGIELFFSAFQLLITLGIIVVIGTFIIPLVYHWIKPFLSTETLTLLSLGLCLAMTMAANAAGLSAALGAFLMGSILGTTGEKHRLEIMLEPIRHLFSAIFFVSIGMLIDPQIFISSPAFFLSLVCVIIFGKFLLVSVSSLLIGHPLRKSLNQGLALGQIGEFSFLIAALSKKVGSTPVPLESLAAALCIVTSFSTPFLVKYRESILDFIESRISVSIKTLLEKYSRASTLFSIEPDLREIQKQIVMRVLLNSVVITTLLWFGGQILDPNLNKMLDSQFATAIAFLVTLVAASPFLWAFVFSKSQVKDWTVHLRTPPPESFLRSLLYTRMILCCVLVGVLFLQFWIVPSTWTLTLAISLVLASLIYLMRFLGPLYEWFEGRFVKNWSSTETQRKQKLPRVSFWEGHLAEFEVVPESSIVGRKLESLPWRDKFGITVTLIERGQLVIVPPLGSDCLMPHDRLLAIGTDAQLQSFEKYLKEQVPEMAELSHLEDFQLFPFIVLDSSIWLNKSLREINLRQRISALVVAIERNGERIMNPNPQMLIHSQDVLWIFSNLETSHQLNEFFHPRAVSD